MISILNTFNEINADINYEWRMSKFPKIIKNYIADKKRKKLHTIITEIEKSDIISIILLFDFLKILFANYSPQNSYGHCSICINPDGDYKSFKTRVTSDPINDMGEIVIADVECSNYREEEYNCVIRYNLIAPKKDDPIKYFFTSTAKNILYDNHTYDSNKEVDVSKIMNDIITRTFINDISKYLSDSIERSMRINL